MKKNRILVAAFFILLACNTSEKTEKYYQDYENVINVTKEIKTIETDIYFGWSKICLLKDYLVVHEIRSTDNGFHLFNKTDYQYVCSFGLLGRGPGEIPNYGQVSLTPIPNTNQFHIVNNGNYKLQKINIKDVLSGDQHAKLVVKVDKLNLPNEVRVLNDSILLGTGIQVGNNHTARYENIRMNYKTGEITPFGYRHSKIITPKQTQAGFNLHLTKKRMVKSYQYEDLFTIYNTKGELVKNIYGPHWEKKYKKENFYFQSNPQFYKDLIYIAYSGERTYNYDENKRPVFNWATSILVFDWSGNYIKTLEIPDQIGDLVIDEEQDRMVLYFVNKEEPLAYINLKDIG